MVGAFGWSLCRKLLLWYYCDVRCAPVPVSLAVMPCGGGAVLGVMLSCGRLVVVCLCPVAWKRCRGVVLLGLCGNAALVVGLRCVLPCRPSRLGPGSSAFLCSRHALCLVGSGLASFSSFRWPSWRPLHECRLHAICKEVPSLACHNTPICVCVH